LGTQEEKRIVYYVGNHRLFLLPGKEVTVAENQPINSHNPEHPEKRSYSVSEAAEILGVSNRSIYNLCENGDFKAVRIGKKLRISKKSFDEWLDGIG